MKKVLAVILIAVAISLLVCATVANRLSARHTAELMAQQAAWQSEKEALETALDEARASREIQPVLPAPVPASAAAPVNAARLSPAQLIALLSTLKAAPGTGQIRAARQAIHALEELIAAGPAALPAIREFLARNEDMEFASASSLGRSGRGGVPDDFIVPPSLRFGLFDVVKRIGGADAERLLAENLGATRRGMELAWLARALQALAPNHYRDAALEAARGLLASVLDQPERDQLFGVLAMYGDTSYVNTAQAQLVQPDGAVDRSALKYLQQSLGPQAVPIAAQTYQNPLLLTNAAAKEPLARLALNFVGADALANEFYQQAINDPVLTRSHRKNLIEDLNQDGFADTRNLTAQDLSLIQNRIALIEELAPHATDPVNAAAFKEAYKDLLNMRDRITRALQPVP